jgi:hypothetical protein
MLPSMKTLEISEWVTSLDFAYDLVRATCSAQSRADAEGLLGEALAALEGLHAQMLRAEVRAIVAKAPRLNG